MPEPNDKSPRLWVDADACPREVRELVFRAAARRGLRVTLVANAWQNVPPASGVDLIPIRPELHHGLCPRRHGFKLA